MIFGLNLKRLQARHFQNWNSFLLEMKFLKNQNECLLHIYLLPSFQSWLHTSLTKAKYFFSWKWFWKGLTDHFFLASSKNFQSNSWYQIVRNENDQTVVQTEKLIQKIITKILGREPWSSGYEGDSCSWSWVRIPASYIGWTFFHIRFCR